MTEEKLFAYCLKCKEKREMKDPEPLFLANGAPATRGTCTVCGSKLFRMGRTPAHEGLPKPEIVKKPAGKQKTAKRHSKKNRNGRRKPIENLVIVESPAKAHTISKMLGGKYRVVASIGHVRDLLRSRLSVDIEHDFTPHYTVPRDKKAVVKEIKADTAIAKEVFLATDPDREGEAIAWHIVEATKVDPAKVKRVVFHEITKHAVNASFQHSRDIDMDLVNAQQARRVLDRLVGYQVSPLLWKNVRKRTSAGRVQSVALRLVVEREREINAFVPREYWSIEAELARAVERSQPARKTFRAKLAKINGADFNLANETETQQLISELEKAVYHVSKVKRGQRRRQAAAPFTTSTLQQEASRKLGFGARKTMRIAQQIYEGIRLDSGDAVGLITYMRTDSTNVAVEAQQAAREVISHRYGSQYLPEKPPHYKTKAKGAQEAHEAIRPTSVHRIPEQIKTFLSKDQFRLYDLIWRRFVASQMKAALYDTLTVEVLAGPANGPQPYLFRASGSQLRFPGFLIVYQEGKDDNGKENGKALDIPSLEKGDLLDLLRLFPEQHFTQPPPRYTEASLVKALEEYGIGRPSTYATILATLQERHYVERIDGRRLQPTELGITIVDKLVKHFPDLFNVEFTAQMEAMLDKVAIGQEDWVAMLKTFYGPFAQALQQAEENMEPAPIEDEVTDEICEKCGSPMVIKYGRYGKFLACSNFPACRNTKPYLEKIGVKCPKCGRDIVVRHTRKGRIFYGCSGYPECDFTSWDRPLPQPCPDCGGLLVTKGKDKALCTQCGHWFKIADLPPIAESGEEAPTVAKEAKDVALVGG